MKSPVPKQKSETDMTRCQFQLTVGQKRKFQAKLARLGAAQCDVLQLFVQAFLCGSRRDSSLGMSVTCHVDYKKGKKNGR